MKDLFCLVNTFMNRSKSADKGIDNNAATSSSTGESASTPLSVPVEASEDTRVLPGATRKNKIILPALVPFLQLLPDLSGVDLNEQKKLYNCLYSAGVTAAISLQKNGSCSYSALTNMDLDNTEWKEIFANLDKNFEFDDSNETYCKLTQKLSIPDELRCDNNDQLIKIITNEVAAFSLTTFAAMICRRPFTKQMETIMAPPQETDEFSNEGENGFCDISRALRDTSFDARATAPVVIQQHSENVNVSTNVNKLRLPSSSPTMRKRIFCGKNRASTLVSSSSWSHNESSHLSNQFHQQQNSAASSVTTFASSEDTAADDEDSSDEDEHADDDDMEEDDDDAEEVEECYKVYQELTGDEDCLFRYVCSIGYEDLARHLMSLRCSTEFIRWHDSTPLMEACCGGYAGVVKALIEAGADVNAQSSTKNTALIYACAAQHMDCVKELLNSGKCDINIRNESGHCALMEAASVNNVEIMKLLVEHGATPLAVLNNEDYKAIFSEKESALTLAAFKGHLEAVKFLLSVIPTSIQQRYRDDELHTALMEASMDGHVEVARALLEAGAKTNLPSDSFESPLTLAACGGHAELASLLIDFGAKLEEPNDEGYTPLMEASREGHRDVVELLLNHGADVNARIDEGMETPLTLAASGGYLQVVELLIERGADLTVGSPLGEATHESHTDVACFIIKKLREMGLLADLLKDLNNALLCAAELDNIVICSVLLENIAQVNCFSQDGRTPLMETAKQGNLHVAELLIHHGANVNLISLNGDCTALSLAASNGHAVMVSFLLKNGADPKQPLSDSSTCLLEATKSGHMNCVEVLLDYRLSNTDLLASAQLAKEKTGKKSKSAKAANRKMMTLSSTSKNMRPKSKNLSQKEDIVTSNALVQTSSSSIIKSEPMTIDEIKEILGSALDDNDYIRAFIAMFQQQKQLIEWHVESSKHSYGSSAHALENKMSQAAITLSENLSTPSANDLANLDNLPNTSQIFRALAAAAAASSYNGSDDFLFAQFVQQSLIATKNYQMTDEQLGRFAELIHQEFRKLFHPETNVPELKTLGTAKTTKNIACDKKLINEENGVWMSEEEVACAHPIHKETKTKSKSLKTKARVPKSDGIFPPIKVPNFSDYKDYLKLKMDDLSSAGGEEHEILGFGEALSTSSCSDSTVCTHYCSQHANMTCTSPQRHDQNSAWITNANKIGVNNASNNIASTPILPSLCACCNANAAARNFTADASGKFDSSAMDPSGRHLSVHSSPSTPVVQQHQHKPCDLALIDAETDSNADTALTVACVGGQVEIANLLIQRGFDMEHRDKKGFTPLILGTTGGHIEICRLLLEAGCQVDAQSDRTKDSALMLACSGGRKEIAELLLHYGANKELRNVSDYTPLSLAASGGYVDIIQLLLNNGAEINSRTGSKLGISPLMLAAMNGHDAATKLLLDHGSDINAQIETNRNTALTLACFQGRTEVVRLLLQYGANMDHRAKTGLTPLMEAANGGFVDVGVLLLDAGADSNAAPVLTSRDTALTIAADKGHFQFVEMLIRAGAQINIRNKKGSSALWLAACNGHIETVRILIKYGADPDAQDNRKVSPLMIAFRKGHEEVVEFLVEHVTQFPNDQDCDRYIMTLSDQELIARCDNCFEFISCAKSKQAEEANKAAESLLELLAQEEALAESKKRTKQRQKEKKKAKKNAKKQVNTEDEEQNEADDELKKLDESATTNDETISEERKSNNNVTKVVEEEENHSMAISDVEESRVPSLGPIHEINEISYLTPKSSEATIENSSTNTFNLTSSNSTKSRRDGNGGAQKSGRRATRRSARGGNSAGNDSSSSGKNNAASSESDAWLHPNNRRRTAVPKSSNKNTSNHGSGRGTHNSSAQHLRAFSGEMTTPSAFITPIDEWVAEPGTGISTSSSKRKMSQTLNVSSQSIARVIGRSGSNINAIREATNAHIEVEKMTTKREQATRTITIKGTPEAIRNSIAMIDILVKEQDLHISDILRRVLGSNTGTPPTCLDMGLGVSDFSNLNSSFGEFTTKTTASNQQQHVKIPLASSEQSSNTNMTTPVNPPNVWQQRAAIREQQKGFTETNLDKQQRSIGQLVSGIVTNETPVSTVYMPSSIYHSAVSANAYGAPPSIITANVPPSISEHLKEEVLQMSKQSLSKQPSQQQHQTSLSQERKAPGYERPNSSSSTTATSSIVTATAAFYPSNSTKSDANTTVTNAVGFSQFNSSQLNDLDFSMFSRMMAGEECRPIAQIWENNSTSDTLFTPTSLGIPSLFENDTDAQTWLSPSTEENTSSMGSNNCDFDPATFDFLNGMGIFPSMSLFPGTASSKQVNSACGFTTYPQSQPRNTTTSNGVGNGSFSPAVGSGVASRQVGFSGMQVTGTGTSGTASANNSSVQAQVSSAFQLFQESNSTVFSSAVKPLTTVFSTQHPQAIGAIGSGTNFHNSLNASKNALHGGTLNGMADFGGFPYTNATQRHHQQSPSTYGPPTGYQQHQVGFPKNLNMFNSNGGDSFRNFMHPPPGFIRQATVGGNNGTVPNLHQSQHANQSTGMPMDNGNRVPPKAPYYYYNNYYNGSY